jgi:hypothetical protein
MHLRILGHGATTTHDIGQERAPDPNQLLTSTRNNWILVTHNRNDFRLLHVAWAVWSQAWNIQAWHAGILLMPHGDPLRTARSLAEFAESHPTPITNQLYDYRPNAGWVPYP